MRTLIFCLTVLVWRVMSETVDTEILHEKHNQNKGFGKSFVTSDAIIVEAEYTRHSREVPHDDESNSTRQERNLYSIVPLRQIGVYQTILTTPECVTTLGRQGSCISFHECYPYFKVTELSGWDGWVLGHYDTCSYRSEDNREVVGVCCSKPPTTPPQQEQDRRQVIFSYQPFANWPPTHPPLPTHPPDHTAATHPPGMGITQPLPTKPPKLPTTTWPTKQPTKVTLRPIQSTTKQPWPPAIPTHTPTGKPSVKPPTAKPPTMRPPQADTGTQGCGMKNGYQDQERIVGGHNAELNEWPWIAVLFNAGRQFCGGSLIDNIHILSAAHCVAHMTSWDVARLTVRLGDHNIKTNAETQHVERKIKRVVRHRGFDMRTLYNDISLLTMDSPIQFSNTIRPICLPGSTRAFTGMTATVIGWGSLRESGPQPSILQEVSIPIWSNMECKLKYGPAAPGGIVDHMLCAGRASKDSCSGDSGGPLMISDGGRWTQVGVVSWGIGCGKGQYPGVYTRITYFLPWIRKNSK